jgi:hypothetical protein
MICKTEEELQKELQILELSVMVPIWTSDLARVQTLYSRKDICFTCKI